MNRGGMLRVLMVAGIVVAFAAGHRVARSSTGAPDREGDAKRGAATGFHADFKVSLTSATAGARSWQEVKEKVVRRWEASPAVMVDFELQEETLRLLEKTPVADLEVWMRELRVLEEQEEDHDTWVPMVLRQMVLKVLAQRGGSSVILALAAVAPDDRNGDVDDALDHWLEHDPVAALDWLDGEMPEVIAEDRDHYREGALVRLTSKDPAAFEKRLSQVSAEVREEVLETYAWLKGTEESRDGVLARAAESPHGEAMALWSGLIRREGEEDPARAYATLAELDISPDVRTELDERLLFWLLYPDPFSQKKIDGAGVMRAWAMRHPGDEVSESTLESFGRWSGSDPDQAAAWIRELPAGDRYDAFAKAFIEKRIGESEAAAGVIAGMRDDDLRVAMQRRLKESWLKIDSDAAAVWESKLPEEDRERLREAEGE